jgi:hypothetical protein
MAGFAKFFLKAKGIHEGLVVLLQTGCPSISQCSTTLFILSVKTTLGILIY